jgi:hypothetical protein
MGQQKWTDYIGKTVNAKYAVEGNVDGADVPIIQEGEVTPYLDSEGSVFLDTDYGPVYPFFETFELIK